MSNKSRKPDQSSETDRQNEGGREFGHVHEPTQAQQASMNSGQAGNVSENRPSHKNQGGLPIRHTYDQNLASQDSANPNLAEQPGRQGQKPNAEKKTA